MVQEGKNPLPCCDSFGMHMPAGRLIKHQWTKRCNRNTQMRLRRRDVAIESRCAEASFSLTRNDKAEYIEGVGIFKYMERPLDRSDNDLPEVRRNIRKARQVWGRLGQLLRREGGYQLVSEMFYQVVVQAVLLFGSETRVLLAAMAKTLEGVHVGFLQQVKGKTAIRQWDRNWRREAAERVLKEEGTQKLGTYCQ